jgi:hypothetical protein
VNVLRASGIENFSGPVAWTGHVLLRLQKHVGLTVLAQLFDPNRLSRAVGDKDLRQNGRRISRADYTERYGDDYDPGAEYWETALGLYVVGPNDKPGPGAPPRAVITLLERKSVSRLVNYGRRRMG